MYTHWLAGSSVQSLRSSAEKEKQLARALDIGTRVTGGDGGNRARLPWLRHRTQEAGESGAPSPLLRGRQAVRMAPVPRQRVCGCTLTVCGRQGTRRGRGAPRAGPPRLSREEARTPLRIHIPRAASQVPSIDRLRGRVGDPDPKRLLLENWIHPSTTFLLRHEGTEGHGDSRSRAAATACYHQDPSPLTLARLFR